jgi:hypothetical protein
MTVKELIDKLQQFDEDKLVLVEDTEYKEFQAIDVEPVDDRFVLRILRVISQLASLIASVIFLIAILQASQPSLVKQSIRIITQ